MGDILASFYAF